MISANRLIAAVVSLASLFAIAPTQAQTSGIDAAQLSMLEQMSPEEREDVLEALLGTSAVGNDRALEFPELIDRDAEDEEEPTEYELFDADGNPLLDDYGRQIVITPQHSVRP